MNLSKHFTLAELTRSSTAERLGLSNKPSAKDIDALRDLAEMLEKVRAHLSEQAGKPVPIIVTSAYRSPAVNKAVGGVTSSDHMLGMAADILAPAFGSPYEVALSISNRIHPLGVGAVILENVRGKQWVHLSIAVPAKAINRILTITDAGAIPGIQDIA